MKLIFSVLLILTGCLASMPTQKLNPATYYVNDMCITFYKDKKELSDKQFIEFIEAHQQRRLGAGKSANDFENALAETLEKME